VFTKNRDAVVAFFSAVLKQADKKRWLSKAHFSVDGTLIQAWAGYKSFVRKDGKDDDDGGAIRGKSCSNETHVSSTEPDGRLFRNGKAASHGHAGRWPRRVRGCHGHGGRRSPGQPGR
jgi:hypothetical protein